MRIRAIALSLAAALVGCQPVLQAPVRTDPVSPAGSMTLFQARLRIGLAMPRRVQTLPDFWDEARVTVESPRLKAPALWTQVTATSSLAPTLGLPTGEATVSVEVRAQGIVMAAGSATASLATGVNTVTVTMAPWVNQVATLVGNGTAGALDGVGAAARINGPRGLALDASGNLLVADTSNHMIRKITPEGMVTTLAGTGTAGFAGDNGPAASAQLNGPSGVTVDASGSVYVADTGNQRIRKIDPFGTITTLAGSGATGSVNAVGIAASFWDPWGIAVDPASNLYVSDFTNNSLRKIDASANVTTLATGLNGPSGLAIDTTNSLVVANYFDSRVLRVSPGGTIMVVGGTGTAGFSGDGGPAASASFSQPRAVAVDGLDNIYVADTFNYRIRKILAGTGIVSTLAGSGTNGMLDGPSPSAQFGALFGIAARSTGTRVYVSDWTNQRLRVQLSP